MTTVLAFSVLFNVILVCYCKVLAHFNSEKDKLNNKLREELRGKNEK